MSLQYTTSSSDSRFLKPTGSGTVDVINDFSWTLTPKSGRREVPYAYLVEYQQTTGQLIAAIVYYARVLQGLSDGSRGLISPDRDPSEVYKYKYFAEPTGFSYKFPYFNPKKTSRKTDFGYDDGKSPFSSLVDLGTEITQFGQKSGVHGGGIIRSLIGDIGEGAAIGRALIGAANTIIPGKFELEHSESWTGTSEGEYSLTFDLFNTGTLEDIDQNRNLAYVLSYQNSPSRRNFAIIDPPVIYSLNIPDVVSFPACYMSGLDITNLGNTRVLKQNNVSRIIPEAYRFTMTFTSLLQPTRNILNAMDKGQTVEAISDSSKLADYSNSIIKQLQNPTNTNLNNTYLKSLAVDKQFNLPQGTTFENTPGTGGTL